MFCEELNIENNVVLSLYHKGNPEEAGRQTTKKGNFFEIIIWWKYIHMQGHSFIRVIETCEWLKHCVI